MTDNKAGSGRSWSAKSYRPPGRCSAAPGSWKSPRARSRSLRTHLASAQREANTDSLTGIANRKYFDHELRAAAEEAITSQRPLCLLLANIDHFKHFNDTFGH